MTLPAKFAERVLRDLGDSEGAALCAGRFPPLDQRRSGRRIHQKIAEKETEMKKSLYLVHLIIFSNRIKSL